MKRTTLFALASALVLMIVVMTAVSRPVSWTQAAEESIDVTVSGPGTVKMVVSGLEQGQEVTLQLESPSGASTIIVGTKKANGQGVIHATEALGNSAEPGEWTATAFVNTLPVATTTFTI